MNCVSYLDEYSSHARVWTVALALRFLLLGKPRKLSEEEYVAECRRLGAQGDYRLIVIGYNRFDPMTWARTIFPSFLKYWNEATARPDTVGSSYNGKRVDVYHAFRLGLLPWITRALGEHNLLVYIVYGRHRTFRKRLRRKAWNKAFRVARAVSRTSYKGIYRKGTPQVIVRSRIFLSGIYRKGTPSLELIEKLGRLCPELQRVAIDSFPDELYPQPVLHSRHVDWEAVSRAQKALVGGGNRVRAAYSVGQRRATLLDGSQVCPAYPYLFEDWAVRLVKGETPVELSGGLLAKKEAHQWLSSNPCDRCWNEVADEDAMEWLRLEYIPDCPPVRSRLVLRWLVSLQKKGRFGYLLKTRTVHGPAGQVAQVRLVDKVDEIQEGDLVDGLKTSPKKAFKSASDRLEKAMMADGSDTVLHPIPRGWRPYRKLMTPLLTKNQLKAEGERMHHCIGGYAEAIEKGQSVIFSVKTKQGSSTVELSPAGRIFQHRGDHNSEAPSLNQKVVQKFVERRL